MTHLTPDEALYAFMDGELELSDEQRLFDSLAQTPELRTEMKDILSIRNAVHRDVLFPSPAAETGILAAAGFAGAAGTAATSATVAAAGTSGWLASFAPILYTLAGSVVGGVVVYMLMLGNPQRTSNWASTERSVTTGNVTAGAPISPEPAIAATVRVDTVFVRTNASARAMASRRSETTTPESVSNNVRPSTTEPESTLNTTIEPTPRHDMTSLPSLTSTQQTTLGTDAAVPAAYLTAAATQQLPVSLRLRSLASGIPSSETPPTDLQNALLPNAAFALTMPLGTEHRIGIEMGSESFRQSFNGMLADRPVEYYQVPVLFWMGANYQYSPTEFSILEGLRPFAEITAGMAFAQGPLARGSIGLQYQPSGPIRFSIGIDGAALMYQFQNRWFNSTKWGITYGISIDMGGFR